LQGDEVREEIRVIHEDGSERWLAITAKSGFEPAIKATSASRRAFEMFGIGSDITERKRREANLALLAAVADELARLSSSDEILRLVGERIAFHLDADCVYLLEIDESYPAEGRLIRLWRGETLPPLPRVSEFLAGDAIAALAAGDTVVVRDTSSDLRTAGLPYARRGIRALVHVPVIRVGQVKFVFGVCDAEPATGARTRSASAANWRRACCRGWNAPARKRWSRPICAIPGCCAT
jgi:hypothetical protein